MIIASIALHSTAPHVGPNEGVDYRAEMDEESDFVEIFSNSDGKRIATAYLIEGVITGFDPEEDNWFSKADPVLRTRVYRALAAVYDLGAPIPETVPEATP